MIFLPVLLPVSGIQETYLPVWEDHAAFVMLTTDIHPSYSCKGKGRSTGSSVDDSAFAGSSHMFREMSRTSASSLSSVASSDNGTPVSVGSSANPTAGSSDVSFYRKTDAAGPVAPVSNSSDDMGTDVVEASTVTEVAQTCKCIIHHIFSKVPSNTIMLYVPIIIEHIKTWAMIDTDSSFSCASPSFCSALGLIPMHNQGSIKLGHNSSSTVSRLGITYLTVHYTQIRLSHEFKVFDCSSDVPIYLGLGILPKLRIGSTGLVTSWLSSNIPKIPDPINSDDYKPNEAPVGTMQERQHLMSTIQPLLDANTSIPMSSHCNLPGAIITLDTEPNAFAYRRQPDIAIANRKIMEDQIQTWLDDCVIEPAPSNTRFNNPIFLVGKKDVNGLYT